MRSLSSFLFRFPSLHRHGLINVCYNSNRHFFKWFLLFLYLASIPHSVLIYLIDFKPPLSMPRRRYLFLITNLPVSPITRNIIPAPGFSPSHPGYKTTPTFLTKVITLCYRNDFSRFVDGYQTPTICNESGSSSSALTFYLHLWKSPYHTPFRPSIFP